MYISVIICVLCAAIPIWLLPLKSNTAVDEVVVYQRQEAAVKVRKFSALEDERVLNVHVVPHTHDDVGWLKTVEQYYYGFNNSIQHAHVQSILDSTITALRQNPNRTFTYVEQRFFSMWWNEQSGETKRAVRSLADKDRLAFVNGGWCMHDEATTHFQGMLDQTTLGHLFLKRELNYTPTVGWQLDPFGHSATQASYMTHDLGFDALYFGRIDYQDLNLRREARECEGLWSTASSDSSKSDGIFWGLTGSYGGNYGPPPGGFCFDSIRCNDEPLVGLSEEDLLVRIKRLFESIKLQTNQTKGNHIMFTMGEDFNYENAEVWMKNLDVMIHSVNSFQTSGQIDASSVLGPRFNFVNMFYSNPNYYTQQKMSEGIDWSTKTDDFFPYADGENAYWTGYFVSRTGFKRQERVSSAFLMAARQIESYYPRDDDYPNNKDCLNGGCKCMQPLFDLEDALGIAQHHDAVSGTAKQHVANDYSKRLYAGLDKAASYVAKKLTSLLFEGNSTDSLSNLSYCPLLNETTCKVSEEASKSGDDMYLVIYNGLAQTRSSIVAIPVHVSQVGSLFEVSRVNDVTSKTTTLVSSRDRDGVQTVYFDTGPMPPTGAVAFKVTLLATSTTSTQGSLSSVSQRNLRQDELINLTIDDEDGSISLRDGQLRQRWGYYTSYDSKLDQAGPQNSGAYIFRPSEPDQEFHVIEAAYTEQKVTDFATEIYIHYKVPWISEVYRIFHDKAYVEVEYAVGPIPVDDGRGKEIVTQYASANLNNVGVFYTDSNGRKFQKRVRSKRPTWNLTETQPVAGNYYPVNTAIYIQDETGKQKTSMGIVTDRTLGGTSLKDGSIELMVQRRTLADDDRGVAEPMNETDGGVTPYPPYGDATRQGDGIVIRGKHRILLGRGAAGGASDVRSQMDDMFSEPLVFVGSAKRGTSVPIRQNSFSLIGSDLPNNVMLVTFMHLAQEPKRTFLIRLGHQYADNEDDELSKATSVNLASLLGGHKIRKCREMTLSGNRDKLQWEKDRYDWKGRRPTHGEVRTHSQTIRCRSNDDCTIWLEPMEIRTFQIQLEVQ